MTLSSQAEAINTLEAMKEVRRPKPLQSSSKAPLGSEDLGDGNPGERRQDLHLQASTTEVSTNAQKSALEQTRFAEKATTQQFAPVLFHPLWSARNPTMDQGYNKAQAIISTKLKEAKDQQLLWAPQKNHEHKISYTINNRYTNTYHSTQNYI